MRIIEPPNGLASAVRYGLIVFKRVPTSRMNRTLGSWTAVFVPRLVLREPVPVVVFLELVQEPEEVLREVRPHRLPLPAQHRRERPRVEYRADGMNLSVLDAMTPA